MGYDDEAVSLIFSAECAFLLWGAVVCYHSRQAPDMYNESVQVGFVIWNESLWCLFYVFARWVLQAIAITGRHSGCELAARAPSSYRHV